MVMAISVAMIYVALVVQFKNTVKPLLVFAAIPFGIVGALTALWAWGRRSASWPSSAWRA